MSVCVLLILIGVNPNIVVRDFSITVEEKAKR
jgi:hypothetical protein